MLGRNQLLSVLVQFGDGGLLGLQAFADEVLLSEEGQSVGLRAPRGRPTQTVPGHLVLPLAGRVVQVGVAPVVVDSLLGLLVHPVELIGAVLHVVPQAQQVALTSRGIGLHTRKTKGLHFHVL